MKAGRDRGIGLLMVAIAAVLQTSPAQADSDGSLIALDGGVGVLRVSPQVSSPVLHAAVSDAMLPTITLWFFPGTALTRRFSYARFLRISTELGVTRHTVSVAGSTVGAVRALPLNFNFEIHPFPGNRFDPFVGPGLNRSYFTVQAGSTAPAGVV
jgi:outer membrane protein W